MATKKDPNRKTPKRKVEKSKQLPRPRRVVTPRRREVRETPEGFMEQGTTTVWPT